MHVHTHTQTHTHKHARTYARTYAHTYAHTQMIGRRVQDINWGVRDAWLHVNAYAPPN